MARTLGDGAQDVGVLVEVVVRPGQGVLINVTVATKATTAKTPAQAAALVRWRENGTLDGVDWSRVIGVDACRLLYRLDVALHRLGSRFLT